jgi:hypothetical protein
MRFDTMTEAYLHMIEAGASAVRSRRAFDICWLSDEHMALTSPTGRFLEEYKMTIEEVTDGVRT